MLIFIAFTLGCAACHALHAHGVPTIPAAAALGLGATFLPRFLPSVFWTGVFVGMSSDQIIGDYVQVLGASAIGTAYYHLARPYLDGVGGKMGAVAFVTTATWLGVRTWIF